MIFFVFEIVFFFMFVVVSTSIWMDLVLVFWECSISTVFLIFATDLVDVGSRVFFPCLRFLNLSTRGDRRLLLY